MPHSGLVLAAARARGAMEPSATLYRLTRAARLEPHPGARAATLERLRKPHPDERAVVVLVSADSAVAFRFVAEPVAPEGHAAPVNGAAPAESAPVPVRAEPAAPAPVPPEPAEDRWDVLVRRYSREFDRAVGGIL